MQSTPQSSPKVLPRLVADDKQLLHALEAFEYAHYARLGSNWAKKYFMYFTDAGIDSMNALLAGCKEDTINLDLDFVGVGPNDRLDQHTIKYLTSFLPGPVGIRCFRLAQMAAEKVRRGEADVKYVHRDENGKAGDELWHVIPHQTLSRHNSFVSPTSHDAKQSDELPAPQWTLHVDCGGFVRSVLKHITKDVVQVSLSDRSFMRAKDFYRFFETIDLSVTDKEILPLMSTQDRIKKWRLVTDLRTLIPGDIIVYRPKGSAAGGAAFTTNDRKDLKHLLKAVRMAQLYKSELLDNGIGHLVTRNLGRDPSVKSFVDSNRAKLDDLGIQSCKQLREKLPVLNDLMIQKGYEPYDLELLQLMKECCETTAKNTGHIVFCAGPPIYMKDEDDYRIKVIHSTKNGVNKTEGVQQYFRRFRLVEGPNEPKWTRPVKKQIQLPTNDTDGSDHVQECPQTGITSAQKQQLTASGESSEEQSGKLFWKNEALTGNDISMISEEGEDQNDDEDIDVDDPEDPDTNVKNENDVPEDDPVDSNPIENSIKSDFLQSTISALENIRLECKDELAGLADVEVLAARMCF